MLLFCTIIILFYLLTLFKLNFDSLSISYWKWEFPMTRSVFWSVCRLVGPLVGLSVRHNLKWREVSLSTLLSEHLLTCISKEIFENPNHKIKSNIHTQAQQKMKKNVSIQNYYYIYYFCILSDGKIEKICPTLHLGQFSCSISEKKVFYRIDISWTIIFTILVVWRFLPFSIKFIEQNPMEKKKISERKEVIQFHSTLSFYFLLFLSKRK